MEVNLDIFEKEHLVGKLKFLEMQNTISSFKNSEDINFERRISQSLRLIPDQYKETAMVLFANIIYFTEDILNDTWRYLWHEISSKYSCNNNDYLFLELDRDLLRDEFYKVNHIPGRLEDNVPWKSAQDIIDTLMALNSNLNSSYIKNFKNILNKKYWILLVDLSISGTSVISEIKQLYNIINLLSDSKRPKIIALIQVTTEDAITRFREMDFDYLYGINVPLNCALNSAEYSLINNNNIKIKARDLCKWFANKYVLKSNSRFSQMALQDEELAIFGFGKRGWNLVTYKNTPNNSLPIIWFCPENNEYIPPFQRIDSRMKTSWSGRRDFIDKAMKDQSVIDKIREFINQ